MRDYLRCFFLNICIAASLFGIFPKESEPFLNLERIVAEVRRDWSPSEAKASCQGLHVLCPHFIGEKTTLSKDQRENFQKSGLTHLIAISSSQITPLIGALIFAVGLVIFAFFPLRTVTKRFREIRLLHLLCDFLSSVSLALFLGGSGALVRAFCVRSLSFWNHSYAWVSSSLFRFLCLCFAGAFLGNPLQNVSFVLSSLGAALAVCSSRLVAQAWRRLDLPRGVEGVMSRSLLTTLATSGSMCISLLLLSSYSDPSRKKSLPAGIGVALESSVSVFSNMFANVLAIPVVGALVTPLAAFKMSQILLQLPALPLIDTTLDFGLRMFEEIARSFSPLSTTPQSFVGILRALSNGSFSILLVALWSVFDRIEAKEWRDLRSGFWTLRCQQELRKGVFIEDGDAKRHGLFVLRGS